MTALDFASNRMAVDNSLASGKLATEHQGEIFPFGRNDSVIFYEPSHLAIPAGAGMTIRQRYIG
jgi:hypothetical protein